MIASMRDDERKHPHPGSPTTCGRPPRPSCARWPRRRTRRRAPPRAPDRPTEWARSGSRRILLPALNVRACPRRRRGAGDELHTHGGLRVDRFSPRTADAPEKVRRSSENTSPPGWFLVPSVPDDGPPRAPGHLRVEWESGYPSSRSPGPPGVARRVKVLSDATGVQWSGFPRSGEASPTTCSPRSSRLRSSGSPSPTTTTTSTPRTRT